MKLFTLSVKEVDYDEYDSCVVVAEDENAVRAMLRDFNSDSKWEGSKNLFVNGEDTGVRFYNHQGEILIEEVDLTKPALVCASFNAG